MAHKFFLIVTLAFAMQFMGCPNDGSVGDPDGGLIDDPGSEQKAEWSVIKNAADIAGVWEGTSQIEILGDGEILPSTGPIGFNVTFMNNKLESKVDMVMKMDFGSYLDEIIAINPDIGYTKDSLWAEIKKGLSGSGYNAGNYFIITSDYTYTSFLTETDDFLINADKNKIKSIISKYDFALMGMNVASDVTLVLEKTAPRPATLIVKGGDDISSGESIIAVKILATTEDSQMELLGNGQINANFSNDGNDVVFSHTSTNFSKGKSQAFMVPGGKYTVKISLYRGSFLAGCIVKAKALP